MELARHLNFQPVDMGTLSSSRDVENMPIQLFPGWKGPVLAAVALSIFFFAYSFVRDIIHPYVKYKQSDFYKIPMEMVNRTLPTVAITLLALVYLAGQLAAAHQLYYGTKYRHFPHWLEGWLQSRKQLGLLSFFLAAVHVLYSLCLPMRRSERYLLLNTAYQQVSGVSTLILKILPSTHTKLAVSTKMKDKCQHFEKCHYTWNCQAQVSPASSFCPHYVL